MLSKLDVGHEVGSEALRNAGTLQLALRVAGSARDDELVVAALECTHEDLQDVHRRVVNVEQVGAVEDHDLSGIRRRDALGSVTSSSLLTEPKKRAPVSFQHSTVSGMSKGSV